MPAIIALLLCTLAPLEPQLYDDLGDPDRSPHLITGSTYTFGEATVDAQESARTVAFDPQAVVLRYEELDPSAEYALRVTYATERDGPRAQRLTCEGVELHGPRELPRGSSEVLDLPVPGSAVQDGVLELSFERVAGPNAVVSEVWLLSDESIKERHLAAHGDLRGNLTALVLDGLMEPLPGVDLTIMLPDGAVVQRETDEAGAVSLDLAGQLEGGEAVVTASMGRETIEKRVAAGMIELRQPRLTPIPQALPYHRDRVIDLDGEWNLVAHPEGETWWETGESVPLTVPGSWIMQGLEPARDAPVGVWRRFHLDGLWHGDVLRLRFDAVYSIADVWLNGVYLGHHEGGFTPFELDATDAARLGGENTLAVLVTSDSEADRLASASSYARHPLGGITRSVRLLALPRAHLTRLHVTTDLDDRYENADLRVMAEVSDAARDAALELRLVGAEGEEVATPVRVGSFDASGELDQTVRVPHPKLWDPEHPHLYRLEATLRRDGRAVQRTERRIGFREVEVRGHQVLLNGEPIKLKGVCRHQLSDEHGRAQDPERARRDAVLMKEANINFVRTAHYPPEETFIEACDELGIMVQEEAPFCWVQSADASSPRTLPLILSQTAEMVERDLSHPSVIFWDLANESAWGENWQRAYDYVKAADPGRPVLMSWIATGEERFDIRTWHYPGPQGAGRTRDQDIPVLFDEYIHVNCYNTQEVVADPGLRQYWGRPFERMWEAMWAEPHCLGGAIWCWADDEFEMPDGRVVGYGQWGLVDRFGDMKPEWWNTKRIYSPVHVRTERPLALNADGSVSIEVENRYRHTDLSELRGFWRIGPVRHGEFRVNLPPGEVGTLNLDVGAEPGDQLEISFSHGQRRVDAYHLPIGPLPQPDWGGLSVSHRLLRGGSVLRVKAGGADLDVDLATGELGDLGRVGLVVSARGVAEDVLRDDAETNDVAWEALADGVEITIRRSLPAGDITYTVTFRDGQLPRIRYELPYSGPEIDAREVGLEWSSVPRHEVEFVADPQWIVSSVANAQWTTTKGYISNSGGRTGYGWGGYGPAPVPRSSRATRYNILHAADGYTMRIQSDGTHHIRMRWHGAASDWAAFRVLDVSNGGGEPFLASHFAGEHHIIRDGDVIEGGHGFAPLY